MGQGYAFECVAITYTLEVSKSFESINRLSFLSFFIPVHALS